VTYRSVAEEAGLPEATLRAFFHTRDELRALGLEFMLNGWVQQAEEFIGRLPQQRLSLNETARLIVEIATVHDAENWTFTRATISGIYERYLQAGKHPELRSVITNYNAVLAELVATGAGTEWLGGDSAGCEVSPRSRRRNSRLPAGGRTIPGAGCDFLTRICHPATLRSHHRR
jgi:AcrR family transcriptional regulator